MIKDVCYKGEKFDNNVNNINSENECIRIQICAIKLMIFFLCITNKVFCNIRKIILVIYLIIKSL